MGLLFCLNYEQDDREKENELKNHSFKESQIIIEDLTSTSKIFQIMYNKIFEKNPFDDYEKVEEISPTKNKVKKKDDTQKNIYLIEKIDEYNDINDIINNILKLDHESIIKIYYVYIYLNSYYIVYDYFYNIINKVDEIPNDINKIKLIMEKLFNTIKYIHEKNIYNIGINFDNFILHKIELKSGKKIIKSKNKGDKKDKSSSKVSVNYFIKLSIIDNIKQNYQLSSIQFYSPEIIKNMLIYKNYKKIINDEDSKNDEWSCGILLYYLIMKELPFKGKNLEEMYNNLQNTNLDFNSEKYNNLSEKEKDLLSRLLEKDKNKRISILECLKHPFIIEEEEKEDKNISIDILKKLFNITKPISKLHEVIISYLSYNYLDHDEADKLNYIFDYIDKDKDNKITEEDLIIAFNNKGIKYTKEQLDSVLYVFDYDKNNNIQRQEFIRHLCDKDELFNDYNMQRFFNAIDYNKNNYIDEQDIISFIEKDERITTHVIEKEFMEQFGMKINDKITYEEFCEAIRKNQIFKKNEVVEIIDKKDN